MSSTLNLKFCPNCGERLSYTSFQAYCAFADCLWNNEECTSPGHQDQGARLAAVAQVDQVGGTITCAACGSTDLYSYLYTSSEFPRFVCNDCDSPLNADGSVWVYKRPSLPVDVPESDTLWQFLTKGYSLNGIRRALVCGDPHAEAEARMLIKRARKNWAQIRAEVGE